MATVDNYIDFRGLSFKYPDGTLAVRDINLTLSKGEYVVVMGPNGAGKTTLSLFLNGTIPTITGGTVEGQIRVAGLNPFDRPVYEMAQKVGIVLQDPEAQLITSDVRSEVAFATENLGLPREEIKKRLDWALGVVRLSGMEEKAPQQLSGGQKQRLAIAANLVMYPEILVLDEPTSQLDPIGTTEVFSVLRDLNETHGMTIVMTEHKSEAAAEFADRIVVLDQGKIVANGEPHDVFGQVDLLKQIFVKVPDVTMLSWKMRNHTSPAKFPVTVAEARPEIERLFREKRVRLRRTELTHEKASGGSSGENSIEVQNVSFTYPGLTPTLALNEVSVSIGKGDFVGLMGQNGSGKTTLVKCILGILKPSKGRILFEGQDTARMRVGDLSKRIGLVLQNPDTQLFKMSVEEEISFGLENIGVPPDEIPRRVSEAVTAAGLESYRKIYPFRLSFGDRRKVAVAAIIAMRPTVLVFDEPTTGQDYKGRYELTEIAKKLNEAGSTIIMITHDMDLIAKYTNRTIVMGQGRVLLEGTTREIFERTDILQQTFLKPPQITALSQELSSFGFPRNVLSVDQMYDLMEFEGS